MDKAADIRHAATVLQQYIENENYTGYDPYDALKSPIFKLPILKSNSNIRFAAQQFVKRFPIDLRPLLFTPKGTNSVTLGLCIQAYCDVWFLHPDQQENLTIKINMLVELLEKMIPQGFHGACWGYDFDWEARYAKIPAFQPTIVATGFITNALFQLYQQTGNEKALELCKSACQFILKDIHRTFDNQQDFCFSYSPFDSQVVFNASMKGVRTLAQVYSVTKDEMLKKTAKSAVDYVMKNQRADGAWIYAKSKVGGWVDNYHTGYILDCLDEFITHCEEESYKKNLALGLSFYQDNFFEKNGLPKFFDKEKYPVDCTAAAQSILTLCRFNKINLAKKVAHFMIKNMQSKSGYFYFRKYKYLTVKTPFMRWSNAWMFAALTKLIRAEHRHHA
jgi:rhamnogalacturonyl hydrolase YesR